MEMWMTVLSGCIIPSLYRIPCALHALLISKGFKPKSRDSFLDNTFHSKVLLFKFVLCGNCWKRNRRKRHAVPLHTSICYKNYIGNLWIQSPWQEVPCTRYLYLWLEIVITVDAQCLRYLRVGSLISGRIITHHSCRQKFRFFSIVRETPISLSLSWSIDGTRDTDLELCPMRDEGIQEGREVGVESGYRHIGFKHGVALWSSPNHTPCSSIQIFLYLP